MKAAIETTTADDPWVDVRLRGCLVKRDPVLQSSFDPHIRLHGQTGLQQSIAIEVLRWGTNRNRYEPAPAGTTFT